MKKMIYLSVLTILIGCTPSKNNPSTASSVTSSSKAAEEKPIYFPDLSFYSDGNPLGGMEVFAFAFPCMGCSFEVDQKTKAMAIKELGLAGTVIADKNSELGHIKGFGYGNMLTVVLSPVVTWDGKSSSLFRVTLRLTASVALKGKKEESHPIVWSANTFIDSSLESETVFAVQILIKEFIKSYIAVNLDKKPIFYIY